MLYLKDQTEKELWRQAALNALNCVDSFKPKDDKAAALFASLVADNIVLAYRKRCEKD
jgi:hypothetical protein